MGWLLAIYGLAMDWAISQLWNGYGLLKDCLWTGYGMAISYLSAIYWLATSWLSTGYGPKSKHIKTVIYYVPKLDILCTKVTLAASNTLDCSVHKIFGYWLAIGWLWPKINTLQDIVIYYYVPKLHVAAINTLDCSVFTIFFYYQLAIG